MQGHLCCSFKAAFNPFLASYVIGTSSARQPSTTAFVLYGAYVEGETRYFTLEGGGRGLKIKSFSWIVIDKGNWSSNDK